LARDPDLTLEEIILLDKGQKHKPLSETEEKYLRKKNLLKAINQHGFMERKDIDELLWSKLPEWMDERQKKTRSQTCWLN